RVVISPLDTRGLKLLRRIVAVSRGEGLPDLHAAAVAVHVAEASNIHQDIEAELLPGAIGAQYFIVPAAVPQTQIEDLPLQLRPHRFQLVANLPVGVVAML